MTFDPNDPSEYANTVTGDTGEEVARKKAVVEALTQRLTEYALGRLDMSAAQLRASEVVIRVHMPMRRRHSVEWPSHAKNTVVVDE
jgi:hypothetical protein